MSRRRGKDGPRAPETEAPEGQDAPSAGPAEEASEPPGRVVGQIPAPIVPPPISAAETAARATWLNYEIRSRMKKLMRDGREQPEAWAQLFPERTPEGETDG